MAKGKRGQVPEEERCRGNSRQSGERCKRRRSPGSDFCIFHGGRAPKAAAHPNFRDGHASKYMPPPTILADYERLLRDGALTEHREGIALADAMIQERLRGYGDGGTPVHWAKLRRASRRARRAWEARDRSRLERALEEVERLVEAGAEMSDRRREIFGLLHKRGMLADKENRRLVQEKHLVSVEVVASYHAALGAALRRHVDDPQTLHRIYGDIAAIAGKGKQ